MWIIMPRQCKKSSKHETQANEDGEEGYKYRQECGVETVAHNKMGDEYNKSPFITEADIKKKLTSS